MRCALVSVTLLSACNAATEGLARDGGLAPMDLGGVDLGSRADSGPPPDLGFAPDVVVSDTGEPPEDCRLISPQQRVDFGAVLPGNTISRWIRVTNAGSQRCLIRATLSVGPFYLLERDSEIGLGPAESHWFLVSYAPDIVDRREATFNAENLSIPLIGECRAVALTIAPAELDFGLVPTGCIISRSRFVTVYNTTSRDAHISNIHIEGAPEFSLAPVSLPITLAAGAQLSLEIFYATSVRSTEHYATLFIDAQQSVYTVARYSVDLLGLGAGNQATIIQRWNQTPYDQVDILFVADNSSTMREELAALIRDFDDFVLQPSAGNIDYHIAVTTLDFGGRFLPLFSDPALRIIRPMSQPSPTDHFRSNLMIPPSSSSEREGFEGALLALTGDERPAHNNGLIRRRAPLTIVFVSDQDDSSPRSTADYFNLLSSIKGTLNPQPIIVSAVVGPAGGCAGSQRSAVEGTRYIELANLTGGSAVSICDSLLNLRPLSMRSIGFRSLFPLRHVPVVSSLAVFVDGSEVPSREQNGTLVWEYDPDAVAIKFRSVLTPRFGSEISASYAMECR